MKKLWLVGMFFLVWTFVFAGPVAAGELVDACKGIPTKSNDGKERAGLLYACIEKLAEELEARPIIPSGAVVAFDRRCPDNGWDLFDRAGGRFVVGAGHHANKDTNGQQLEIYEKEFLNGGEEKHTLTVEEMPSHSHSEQTHFVGAGRAGSGDGAYGTSTAPTSPVGSSQPHNNMPPYIALFFCVKK